MNKLEQKMEYQLRAASAVTGTHLLCQLDFDFFLLENTLLVLN